MSTICVFQRRAVATLLVLAAASSAQAQGTTSYGRIDFRWRERGLGLLPVNQGKQTTMLPASATALAGSSLNAVTNPNDATDARFSLILEARVTSLVPASPTGGIRGFTMSILSTDSRSQGTFAANNGNGAFPELRNAAIASTAVATSPQPLGPGQNWPAAAGPSPSSDRGIFQPFRALIGSAGGQTAGIQNLATTGPRSQVATMENMIVATDVGSLIQGSYSEDDPDLFLPGPLNGRYDLYGAETWVPLAAVVYNISDVSTPRTISIVPEFGFITVLRRDTINGGAIPTNTGGYGWNSTTGDVPAFQIVIPAPGCAVPLLLGACSLHMSRRRVRAG